MLLVPRERVASPCEMATFAKCCISLFHSRLKKKEFKKVMSFNWSLVIIISHHGRSQASEETRILAAENRTGRPSWREDPFPCYSPNRRLSTIVWTLGLSDSFAATTPRELAGILGRDSSSNSRRPQSKLSTSLPARRAQSSMESNTKASAHRVQYGLMELITSTDWTLFCYLNIKYCRLEWYGRGIPKWLDPAFPDKIILQSLGYHVDNVFIIFNYYE